jgi:hypothetical protein
MMLLSALVPSWKLALDAAGKSPKTISSYLDSAKRLEAYLTTEGLPLEPEGILVWLASISTYTSDGCFTYPAFAITPGSSPVRNEG